MTKEENVFNEFVCVNADIRSPKSDEMHQYVAELLVYGECTPFEAPDLYVKNDNTICIVEHFAFDGSETNRKGSRSQRERARIQRAAEEEFIKNNSCYHLDSINGEYCYEDYVKNALDGLQAHYEKITAYKEHLKNEGVITPETNIKVFFLVEDVSPLPLLYKAAETRQLVQPVTLAYSKEFLNVLAESPDLDGVILCQRGDGVSKCTWLILRAAIAEYYERTLDYRDEAIISFNPKTITYNMPLPQ